MKVKVGTLYSGNIEVGDNELDKRYASDKVMIRGNKLSLDLNRRQALELAFALLEIIRVHIEDR